MISPKRHLFYWLVAAICAAAYRLIQWLGEMSGISPYLLGIIFTSTAIFTAQHATYNERWSLVTYYTILGAAVVSLGTVANAFNKRFAPDPEQDRLGQELAIHIQLGFLVIAETEWRKFRVRGASLIEGST